MEMLAKINWVDILIVILVLRTSYVSLQDGLSHELLPLAGSVCMLVLPLHYYAKISLFLYNGGLILPIELLNPASFILLAIVIGILFKFVKAVIDKIIKVSWHPFIEKFGGLLAGVIRGSVLTSTILIIIMLIPLPYLQWSVKDRSLTGLYFLRIGPVIYEKTCAALPAMKVDSANAKELMKNLLLEKSIAIDKIKKPASKE